MAMVPEHYAHELDDLREQRDELLAALKEMREACAAAFRVIQHGNLSGAFIKEAEAAGVTNGFGVRAQDAIAKAEGQP